MLHDIAYIWYSLYLVQLCKSWLPQATHKRSRTSEVLKKSHWTVYSPSVPRSCPTYMSFTKPIIFLLNVSNVSKWLLLRTVIISQTTNIWQPICCKHMQVNGIIEVSLLRNCFVQVVKPNVPKRNPFSFELDFV